MRGSPAVPRARKPLAMRFAANWMPEPNTGCWLWLGYTNLHYGSLTVRLPGRRNKNHLAHRLSYEMHVGPIPAGMEILHRCDTPLCVNPEHLSIGTHGDNMRDASAKGRARGRMSRPETLTHTGARS